MTLAERAREIANGPWGFASEDIAAIIRELVAALEVQGLGGLEAMRSTA